ncbi:putative serine acetyltransferase [Trypanosoma grayi]|uniref:putative serine acetyltransferase n=1 Tax=Trypanosoma grayi TaxID=71804 RepID=UPI0004F48FE1|nr:putative serine acetyltransferase [Trypanosoma grayi]KEG14140.1 putative serine acetyltransferase [Trypanosoma grayi]
MRRLNVIRNTITALGLDQGTSEPPREISISALSELMDCIAYIVFPEYTIPPKHCAHGYVRHLDGNALLQWTLTHMADLLSSQLYYAFLIQGHTGRHDDSNEYKKPLAEGQGEKSVLRPHAEDAEMSVETNSLRVEAKQKAEEITEAFLSTKLPHLRWLLRTDADALFQNDVAASSPSEVVLCYPGIRCMRHQRTAHELYHLGAPNNLTRLLTEMAHSTTGIDIHPATVIGHHFFIDHGTGIVIGETAIIGNYVSIYQGVTLGAKSFPVDAVTGKRIRQQPRHPIIEDRVTIYANAVVLGRVRIGEGSTIGGNCWVVRDLPPRSVIVQKPNTNLSTAKMMFHSEGSGI